MPSNGTKDGLSLQHAQIVAAEEGIHKLLNDDLAGAKAVLEAQKDSPYALAGLGICSFLTAAIGMEDDRLSASMETLGQAERAAKKNKASAVEVDPGQWWTQPGLEYEILVADVVAAQSLLHILGDSYVDYAKAMWKLNAAFKYFATIYKAVFPKDVTPDSTVASIVADLNDRYQASTLASSLNDASVKSTSKTSGALNKLKAITPSAPVSRGFGLGLSRSSATHPSSATPRRSIDRSPPRITSRPASVKSYDGNSEIRALWSDNPITAFIVSGGAFGHALFELVFALLPPKARKMFSWLGYGTGDRKKALKLLEMTAITGTDIHCSFAALVLVSYYSAILIGSGWQCNQTSLLISCQTVLERAMQQHENGTLWRINRAKLDRIRGDVESAHEQIQEALKGPSTFRQGVSTMQYELCWIQLSLGKYAEASAGFARMADLNSWSHSTYYALSAASMQEVESRTPEQEATMREMYAKVPQGFNGKRLMGQPPSSEIYLEKRMKFYTAKTDRWVKAGKLPSGSEWYQSVQITVAMELSLYWNQFAHYPQASLDRLIPRLQALLSASPAKLDTPEEAALCNCILGAAYIKAGDYTSARKHLGLAETASASPPLNEAYTYLVPLSKLYLAVLECKAAEADPNASKETWKAHLTAAEGKLDGLFLQAGYDMQGRVESRGQMLRVEIAEKKAQLGLP